MDQIDADPRRQGRLRHRHHPDRRNPETHFIPDPGCGESRRPGWAGCRQGGRFLRRLHGRNGHRIQRSRAAQTATGRLRGHRGRSCAGARHRRTTARGRGRAEQHQLRDRESVWNLGHTGPRRSSAHVPLSAARRSGDARPRILSFAVAANGAVAEAILGAHRANVHACRLHRSGLPRHASIRPGDRHGRGTRHARRIGGRALRGAMETGGPAVEGARARLAGAARSRRIERASGDHRVAPQSGHGPRRAGFQAAARSVEGLARAARHRKRRGLSSQSVRRRALQLLRQGAQRNPANPPAVAARNRFDQLRSGGRGRQDVCGTLFPRGNQGEGGSHGPRSGEGVRQAYRLARLDVARNQGQGEGEAGYVEGGRGLSRSLARLLRS